MLVPQGGAGEVWFSRMHRSIETLSQTPLFAGRPTLGAGFHNIGRGVLRASNETIIETIEAHYGERCGHIPLVAEQTFLLVDTVTPAIEQQVAYLARLFRRDLHAVTFAQLARIQQEQQAQRTLVVPYVNVPEAEQQIRSALGTETEIWGLPSSMVDLLKNKARFYEIAADLQLPGFAIPEYTIASVYELIPASISLLRQIEELYYRADLAEDYPLGLMLRAAESDGNYGCSQLTQEGSRVTVIQNGEAQYPISLPSWQEALTIARSHLLSTMNPAKEERIVISRFLDMEDSPGLSLVLLNGEVSSLGWNGQLQLEGSTACVGTSTYLPKNEHLARLQESGEDRTEQYFAALLRQVASRCQVDFDTIRGIANLDIMLPGPLEQQLQRKLKRQELPYLAECNPRWTNYTDAILTVLNMQQRTPTVAAMREVIEDGIFTIDKHFLPEQMDPSLVRSCLIEQDEAMNQSGVKIICRMAHNPMGLILTGERVQARQQLDRLVNSLTGQVAD
jgi:hypothetical protein